MGARRFVCVAFVFAACSGNQGSSSRSSAGEHATQGEVAGHASDASAAAGSDDASRAMAGGSSASSKPNRATSESGSGGAIAGRAAASMSAGHGGSGAAGTVAMSAASGSAGHAGAAGASSPTGKLYSDDFESGSLSTPSWIDADPDLGGKWMIVAADGGNKALAQTASVSDWVIAAGGDYRWTNQVVEARVRITSDPGKAGIFARLSDTRNYYFLYIDGGSSLVLKKRVDNSSDDVQKMKVQTQANTWYTLKLSVIGDQIQGYLDGKMLVSGSDSSLIMGGIGVGTSDCTAEFDDIVVNGS